jgi:HAD superfamily hydrolase (TIGR01509 family)
LKIAAVAFDMDGVLIDAREWHYLALNKALSPFGLEISESQHLERFDGLSTKQKLNILSEESGLPYELHNAISRVKQDQTLRFASTFCYPNVHHLILLNRLKQLGISVGLYTNSIRETTEFMLKHAKIFNTFDSILTNQDVAKPKPSPEGYLKTALNLRVDPAAMLVVEDGHFGIQAAESAGCPVARVRNPSDVTIELLIEYIPELGLNK